MKNAVFRDATPCVSCKNRRSSETSVLTRATWYNIPEDGILEILYHSLNSFASPATLLVNIILAH
jgi:hypothetical protein